MNVQWTHRRNIIFALLSMDAQRQRVDARTPSGDIISNASITNPRGISLFTDWAIYVTGSEDVQKSTDVDRTGSHVLQLITEWAYKRVLAIQHNNQSSQHFWTMERQAYDSPQRQQKWRMSSAHLHAGAHGTGAGRANVTVPDNVTPVVR